ncbi:hypothetical protein Mal4_16550 [Maioricimonas rarisocia]|uniref:DUF1569 domain-containing protein n=1 Tax=Maioricimonas rarisocia TaxID=2528026 RepID=A0A517Z4I8_9PLAN|nr:DUF1569 domain-containing protein [Maioricimonas rarisocia]QDU37345.1 hypothetical protein Mal4_16550 [Maioricimonas rarisocia]
MSASTSLRRPLRFESLDEIVEDVQTTTSGSYHVVGRWSYGQILDHLARSTKSTFDGFGFQAHWTLRTVAAPFLRHAFLYRPMRAGFRLPASAAALIPSDGVTVEESLARLIHELKRFESETPTAPHPLLGKLSHEEYVLLCLRHSELHLSFVIPEET